MKSFHYSSPAELGDALALLHEHGSAARLLAGGTDLLVRMRTGHTRPQVVIDLKRIKSLRSDIVEANGCLRIGALTVMRQIIEDARVQQHFAALVEAAAVVGSVQIRNRATLAGNICNASPAADTAPALLVYGAIANLASQSGRRSVPVVDFLVGPGKTVLNRGEIVESIDLPLPSEARGAAFGRVTRRRGVDLATVSLCCLVKRSGETLFGYGAVGPRPFLARDDSGVLAVANGKPEETAAVLNQMIAQAAPISDVRGSREYRLAMLHVMSRRTLEIARSRLQA